MDIEVCGSPEQLGIRASRFCAARIKDAIADKGNARILLSTGASQFDTLKFLAEEEVDWSKVEMFHLDEYVDLPENHPASFRKYLKERFIGKINLKKAFLIEGEGDIEAHMEQLTRQIRQAPVDLALIGIGENAHVASNDPPADFETKAAFRIVTLDEACRQQRVGEGWFRTMAEVPSRAISMTVFQIMQSRTIVSCVPYRVKADAVKRTLDSEVTPLIPATILKTHGNWTLFLDQESASLLESKV